MSVAPLNWSPQEAQGGRSAASSYAPLRGVAHEAVQCLADDAHDDEEQMGAMTEHAPRGHWYWKGRVPKRRHRSWVVGFALAAALLVLTVMSTFRGNHAAKVDRTKGVRVQLSEESGISGQLRPSDAAGSANIFEQVVKELIGAPRSGSKTKRVESGEEEMPAQSTGRHQKPHHEEVREKETLRTKEAENEEKERESGEGEKETREEGDEEDKRDEDGREDEEREEADKQEADKENGGKEKNNDGEKEEEQESEKGEEGGEKKTHIEVDKEEPEEEVPQADDEDKVWVVVFRNAKVREHPRLDAEVVTTKPKGALTIGKDTDGWVKLACEPGYMKIELPLTPLLRERKMSYQRLVGMDGKSCVDVGKFPITDRESCEAAARALKLDDVTATVEDSIPRPEGCYLLGGVTLWLATNPANRGVGGAGVRESVCSSADISEIRGRACTVLRSMPETLPPSTTTTTTLPTKPPTKTTTGKVACTKAGEDCLASHCCADPGLQCYVKNQYWASCNASCSAGKVNPKDADSKPWSCKRLGERTPMPEEDESSDNTTEKAKAVLKKCAWPGEDCSKTKCCNQVGTFCFLKNEYYSGCMDRCKPGYIDPGDKDKTPWNCTLLGYSRVDEDDVEKADPGEAAGSTLFCLTVSTADWRGEADLLDTLRSKSLGIFGCEGSATFDAAPSPQNKWKSLLNAKSFIDVWDTLVSDGLYKNFDWTVKADPDTVFFPARLKQHLVALGAPAGMPVYVLNMKKKPGLKGSLEIFSKTAVDAYAENRDECAKHLDRDCAEDFFMKTCLDAIGVGHMTDSDVLDDKYTWKPPYEMSDFKFCTNGWAAAFHPEQSVADWLKCQNMSHFAAEKWKKDHPEGPP